VPPGDCCCLRGAALTGVELADGRVVSRAAVFIRPGNVPHADGLLTGLGCAVDEAGFVTADASGQTSTDGVWAAGNVVNPRVQVILQCTVVGGLHQHPFSGEKTSAMTTARLIRALEREAGVLLFDPGRSIG
jgi:alkyl hydroperoxide reductase subunit AhpF